MLKIDKNQAAFLRQLMKEPGWDILMTLLGSALDELTVEKIVGNTDFETLRALHKAQGKEEGLKEFFDDIERGAFE